jgi:hypothetical protein
MKLLTGKGPYTKIYVLPREALEKTGEITGLLSYVGVSE